MNIDISHSIYRSEISISISNRFQNILKSIFWLDLFISKLRYWCREWFIDIVSFPKNQYRSIITENGKIAPRLLVYKYDLWKGKNLVGIPSRSRASQRREGHFSIVFWKIYYPLGINHTLIYPAFLCLLVGLMLHFMLHILCSLSDTLTYHVNNLWKSQTECDVESVRGVQWGTNTRVVVLQEIGYEPILVVVSISHCSTSNNIQKQHKNNIKTTIICE